MKKKIISCFNIIVLLSCLVLSAINFDVDAAVDNQSAASAAALTDKNYDYASYSYAYEKTADAVSDIVIKPTAELSLDKSKSITKSFTVTDDAKYELLLSYKCLDAVDAVVSLEIDGKSPFEGCQRLSFPMFWVNSDKEQKDEAGNEFSPDQILYGQTVTSEARDYTGRYEYAYRFALPAGEHAITLKGVTGNIAVTEIRFSAPKNVLPYKAPEDKDVIETEPIILEGEDAALKNSRSLIPLSDATSALVHPSDPWKTKLNYIGGSNWARSGDAVFWDFYVKKSGYYSLGFLYSQSYNLGGVSYRTLKIDGQIPFKEAERVKFVYTSDWEYYDYANGDTPYYIYLEAGEHTLSLTATAGAMSQIYDSMQSATSVMGDLYVDITKIVGETIDVYRSYDLFKQIPDFNERLTAVETQLEEIADGLEKIQEKNSGSQVSTIRNAIRVIRQMLDNPYTAHRYKSNFYDAYTNLSSLMGEMTNMPLDIDRIILNAKGSACAKPSVSFGKRISFSFMRFIASFANDYKSADKETAKGSLTIWVNWGRDQARVLNSLIQDNFVRKTGIKTEVSIVNATLIQAILSGNGPDVLLQLPRTEPLNYAMRGALYDLTEFEDLPQILERFNKGAEIPYRYEGGVYALPDTQSFNMMFVRTDILKEMGIDIPKTWDELIKASNLLQRNNLQVYIPGQTIYPTLLVQNGLSLYNEELSASTLTELPQIQVFDQMTSWYTKYKLPVTVDFYNRFRIGSVPIGIYDYSMYTQLKAAAPEIAGRWVATELPGVIDENGKLCRQSAGTGTGCAITQLTDNPENAWEFLKWWTDADTQNTYSKNLESVIGPLGRLTASNLKAFAAMDWDADMLDGILAQQNNTVEIPEVPGGYYTTRCLTQAFWYVVEQGASPTESLIKWGEILDNEISRKRSEYIKAE